MSKGSKPRPTGPQYSANYDAIQWTTKPRCLEFKVGADDMCKCGACGKMVHFDLFQHVDKLCSECFCEKRKQRADNARETQRHDGKARDKVHYLCPEHAARIANKVGKTVCGWQIIGVGTVDKTSSYCEVKIKATTHPWNTKTIEDVIKELK